MAAVAEARAGAKSVHAAFVAINVVDERAARKLGTFVGTTTAARGARREAAREDLEPLRRLHGQPDRRAGRDERGRAPGELGDSGLR